MRKSLKTLLCASAFVLCACGTSETASAVVSKKQIQTETAYLCEDASDESGCRLYYIKTNDEAGNVIKEEHYYDDGSCEMLEYTYDDLGRTASVTYTYTAEAGTVKEVQEYEYGDNYTGTSTINEYDEEGSVIGTNVSSETYNTDWQMVSSLYREGDLLTYVYTSTYDENGNQADWRVYDLEGTLLKERTWEYDENGYVTKSVYTGSDGDKYVMVYVNTVDEDGRLTLVENAGSDIEARYCVYEYTYFE